MRLKQAGFFKELKHGDGLQDEPSIHTQLLDGLRLEKENIVAYLEAGSVYAVAAGVTFDYFQLPQRHIIGGLTLLTDGIWLWPSDLAYYMRHYQVAVPYALVAHMKTQGWRPPQLTVEELRTLAHQQRV